MCPKVYEATVKHPLDASQVQRLLAGVVLDDDPNPARAAACEAVGPHHLRLTLTEGKIPPGQAHGGGGGQPRRSPAHSVGYLRLPDDLASGQWRWLSAQEVAAGYNARTERITHEPAVLILSGGRPMPATSHHPVLAAAPGVGCGATLGLGYFLGSLPSTWCALLLELVPGRSRYGPGWRALAWVR